VIRADGSRVPADRLGDAFDPFILKPGEAKSVDVGINLDIPMPRRNEISAYVAVVDMRTGRRKGDHVFIETRIPVTVVSTHDDNAAGAGPKPGQSTTVVDLYKGELIE
jgi:hypothetical protein